MWGFIWRHCKELSPVALRTLYCSLVRSHLEYCGSVWSPIYNVDVELLEKVQKKFLRSLEFRIGYKHIKGDYNWIMHSFNITQLSVRRHISDACVLHNIIHGFIENSDLLARLSFLVPFSNSRSTRSRNIFRVANVSTNLCRNHPLHRMMMAANRLSNGNVLVFNSNFNKFRRQVSIFYRQV